MLFCCLFKSMGSMRSGNGFTPKMGAEGVRITLKVMQGIPVPKIVHVTRTIITTKDTDDIKGERPWDEMAKPGWPLDFWMDNSLPEEMLPKAK